MRRPGCRAVTLWIALCAVNAVAQGTGGLRVSVVDPQGNPLSRAHVVLRHDAGRLAPQSMATDDRGSAEFPVLAAEGKWTVHVVLDDGGEVRRKVTVVLGKVTPVVIRITAAPDAPSDRAPGGMPQIETTASITRFPEEFVRDLPIPGRFYQQVLPLAPGVDDADNDGNPRVHGSTSRDFRALVNNVANIDPLTQQFMSFTNSDSIEQIAVIPTGAGLEYGRAQGGFAEIKQKIGGNRYSVSAELRYRSSRLDGSRGAADGTGEVDFQSVQPSLMVSGPIVKDKAWFRMAWEQVNQELPIDILQGVEVQTRDQTLEAYQLTWQASARHRLALQYQSDPLQIRGFGIDSSVALESSQRVDVDSDALSLVWTVPWSSRLLVESTIAIQDRSTRLGPEQPGVLNDCVTGGDFLEQSHCTWVTQRDSGSFFRSVEAETDRWTLASHATWYVGRAAGAAHLLRFGFEFEGDTVERTTARNTRSALFIRDTIPAKFTPEPIILLAANVPLASSELDTVDATNWNVYIEDSVRPSRGLVVDFGLRLDREEIDLTGFSPFDPGAELAAFLLEQESGLPGDVDNFTIYEGTDSLRDDLEAQTGIPAVYWFHCGAPICPPFRISETRRTDTGIVIRNTNLSPRLAVSWDPWSNGRTKFAASARRFYGSLLLTAPLLESETPTVSMLFDLEEDTRYDSFVATGFATGYGQTIDATVVDHTLETPYQDEWRLVVERELWQESRLHVEYVNREYRDQLQFAEINRQAGDFGRCRVADIGDPSTLIGSPGSGFEIVDPFTGEVYVDSDPGDGDGRIDDCAGSELRIPVENDVPRTVERPNGRPDDYVQNPFWGPVAKITNDGRRDYEAFVVEFVRRQFRGWAMQASYVWSRFEGSGEPVDPYVGPGQRLEAREGTESNDQRHVLKIASSGAIRGDWHLGGVMTWQSGLPYSLVRYALESPANPPGLSNLGSYRYPDTRIRYQTDERNSERNDDYWLLDFRVAKGFTVGADSRLELALDVFNLFDDRPLAIYNPDTEIGLQVNGIAGGRREFGRSFQLGLRFSY